MTIHIGAGGLPCVDASTGNVKLHSSACCVTCTNCRDSNAPLAWKIVIEGIENGTCDQCTLYNDSYVLPFQPPPADACQWKTTVITDHCETDPGGIRNFLFHVLNVASGSDYDLGLQLGDATGSGIIGWNKDNTPPVPGGALTLPICVDVDEVVMESNVNSGTVCDGSDSTCTLTAL
jgi:hypothetical protein